MIGKVTVTTKNPPCARCGGMAGHHSKDCAGHKLDLSAGPFKAPSRKLPVAKRDDSFAQNEARNTSIEEMIADLEAAGWKRWSATRWLCPRGGLYRGPTGAYKAEMARRREAKG